MNLQQRLNMQRKIHIEERRLERLKTDHRLHLMLSIAFLGLWVPVWAFTAFRNANLRHKTENLLKGLHMALSVADAERELGGLK